MAAQTPMETGAPGNENRTGGAIEWTMRMRSLWTAALVLLAGGAIVVINWVGRGDATWFPEVLVLAVPAGLVLGAAMTDTLRAYGRRPLAFIWVFYAVLVAMVIYALAGGVGSVHFAESGVCSPGQIAQYQALTFYDDLAQTPSGKSGTKSGGGGCYATYAIDSAEFVEPPTKQGWATMNELLAQNGWERYGKNEGCRHCFRKGDYRMYVRPGSSASFFELEIRTGP